MPSADRRGGRSDRPHALSRDARRRRRGRLPDAPRRCTRRGRSDHRRRMSPPVRRPRCPPSPPATATTSPCRTGRCPTSVPLRGVVLLVHGLGEHAGRYDHVARRLNELGLRRARLRPVRPRRVGRRARRAAAATTRLVDDLADLVESTRSRMAAGLPLILLGHSLGGLVAASFVARGSVHGRWPGAVLAGAGHAAERACRSCCWRRCRASRPTSRVGNGAGPALPLARPGGGGAPTGPTRACTTASRGRLARFIADGGPQVRGAGAAVDGADAAAVRGRRPAGRSGRQPRLRRRGAAAAWSPRTASTACTTRSSTRPTPSRCSTRSGSGWTRASEPARSQAQRCRRADQRATGTSEPQFSSVQPWVVTSTPEASELSASVANTKKFSAPWARSFSSGA